MNEHQTPPADEAGAEQTPPTEQTGAHETADPAEGAGPAPKETRARCRDRTYGLRGVVAVALAGLVVGGLGVGTVAALVDHDRDGRHGQVGPPFAPEGRPGPRGLPPGLPGQDPPTTAPDQDVQPDDGASDGAGGTNG